MNIRLYGVMLATLFAISVNAQEKWERGNPSNADYAYLMEYGNLKDYIDRDKYPNFKLGVGTTVDDYNQKGIVYKMTNANFTETVAGNAMKMGSCVSNNGIMDFSAVKNYVNNATAAGLSVYGHVLAWHSQQPVGWLTTLMKDKPDPNDTEGVNKTLYSKDFRNNQTVGWKPDGLTSSYGCTLSFDNTNGLNIHTTKKCTNFWDVQFQGATNISLEKGKSYKATFTLKGSASGTLHTKLAADWTNGDYKNVAFTNEWQDVVINYTPLGNDNFLLLQCGDFVGDIYVKNIKIDGVATKTIPQTAQEIRDTLVYAMDKWIKGMMEACDGKVKAWDLVNEAVFGEGNDGEGNYVLQSASQKNSGSWDVGGSAFYWQDYLGSLDYVRQACRLARKYGPEDVKLFINDYNLESTWDDNKKVKSLINWIKKWEADGVTKIDGIGTQMHISYYLNATDQAKQKKCITTMFELMAATGKLVRVSELDMGICDRQFGNVIATADVTEEQHKLMADYYKWIYQEYLRIIPPAQQWGICQWCPTDAKGNISDIGGWRNGEPVGYWTLDYYRKHAYAGVCEGLGGVDFSKISIVELVKLIDKLKSDDKSVKLDDIDALREKILKK